MGLLLSGCVNTPAWQSEARSPHCLMKATRVEQAEVDAAERLVAACVAGNAGPGCDALRQSTAPIARNFDAYQCTFADKVGGRVVLSYESQGSEDCRYASIDVRKGDAGDDVIGHASCTVFE